MNIKLSSRAITLILVIVLVGGLVMALAVNRNSDKPEITPSPTAEVSLVGCYVAQLGKDRYTIDITSQVQSAIKADIAYENFQKDSSRGTFVGGYSSGILSGMYAFTSEGMNSNRELFFKRDGQDFLAGFGPVTFSGDTEKLTRPLKLTWDQKYRYVKSADCSPSRP